RFLRRLASSWLRRFGGDGAGPENDLAGVLDTLAAQEAGERAAGGAASTVDRNQARQRLDCLLAEAAHQPTSPSEEGVAVLDAMQARGVSFRILFLIGLSNDQWPRRIHPDPYLPDGERRKLQEKFGIQIPLKETAREEDRLLLALLLGAARDRLILSFQRADDGGRARAHSTVWREIARIVAGRAEAAALLETLPALRIIPTDPASRAGFELYPGRGGTGLLNEKEAAILAAGSAADPVDGLLTQMEGMGRLTGGITQGAEYLRAVNRWSGGDLAWDGSIGKILPARKYLSASRIGTMGRCPLQYFFGYGLGVEELVEPERAEPIDKRLVGDAIHAVLEIVYRRLVEENRFPIADGPEVRGRAAAILREAGPQALAPLRESLAPQFPLLWSIYEKEWYASIESFLDFDLRRMEREKVESVVTEERIEAEVSLPTRDRIRLLGLQGILDRVDRLPDHLLRIADYKASRNLKPRVNPAEILKGNQVQMPIYVFLARQKYSRESVRSAQILGVGPENGDPGDSPADTAPEIQVPADPAGDDLWRGIGDTIWQLSAMIDRGLFPFRAGRYCDWCAFRPACRKDHAPSADRVEDAADFRPFYDLAKRSTRKIFGPEEVS
ncbi:MAG: PD-(D/E)XK nuclease family protein, partial [Acidobacteria bacterium]|nr:PD-(D/E)XK nuclease family protein [Acidobacteriota bacterium]